MALATTKLSSKGQVVIPEEIRISLGLEEGAQFVVIGQGDTVILKVILQPPMSEFRSLLNKAHSQAKTAKVKRSDLKKSIAKARKKA